MTNALVPVQVVGAVSAPAAAREGVALQALVFRTTRTAARPVPGLMTWVLDRRNLAAAWEKVSAADGADTPGTDGATCAQLRHRVGPWLAGLAEDLFHDRYAPGPVRWIDIPKPNKPTESRRIGILSVRDRVVQTALRLVLEPVLEPTFLPTSFGFRPGRSTAGALETAATALSAGAGRAPSGRCAVTARVPAERQRERCVNVGLRVVRPAMHEPVEVRVRVFARGHRGDALDDVLVALVHFERVHERGARWEHLGREREESLVRAGVPSAREPLG